MDYRDISGNVVSFPEGLGDRMPGLTRVESDTENAPKQEPKKATRSRKTPTKKND